MHSIEIIVKNAVLYIYFENIQNLVFAKTVD